MFQGGIEKLIKKMVIIIALLANQTPRCKYTD